MAAAGAISVLLDIIPVAAGILLLIAFIRGRRERKAEEKRLNQVISDFSDVPEEKGNLSNGDDHE